MKGRAKKVHLLRAAAGLVVVALLFVAALPFATAAGDEAGKWQGADEAVVERIAREHGREPRPPLIGTDRGDLVPFVFLLAGAGGGFAAGYYFRKLVERKGP